MIRQRITIHNPSASHEGVVTHLDKSSLQLKAPAEGLFVEKRIVLPKAHPFPLIDSLRVQIKTNELLDGHKLFNFPSTQGSAFYVSPTQDYTHGQQSQLIEQAGLLVAQFAPQLTNDQWIGALHSIYVYNQTVGPEIVQNLAKITPEVDLLEDEYSILDILVTKGGISIKQVYHTDKDVTFNKNPTVPTEIGLFLIDPDISSPDDLTLSGIRVLFNEDDDPEDENIHKTMFHLKPRHRHLESHSVTSSIVENGLHPIIKTSFDNGIPTISDDDVQECKLYYHLNLQKALIFDKYQSVPPGASLVVQNGHTELEAPVYKVLQWGNEILFEFDEYNSSSIDFTLHSRYQAPDQVSESTTVSNPKPEVFIACGVSDEHLLEYSPLDNKAPTGGNYELYFTNDTVFYHFPDTTEGLLDIDVPHGTADYASTSSITTIAVAIGTLIVLASLLRSALGRGKTVTKEKKDQ